jgi:hypothetical protein
MGEGVAPLPRLANRRGGAGSSTAGASCSRLLALGAGPQPVLVRVGRVSQSDGHDNGKQRYSKGLQHRFFLPFHAVKKATRRGGPVCNTLCRIPSRNAASTIQSKLRHRRL